jgi:hypothetical protein
MVSSLRVGPLPDDLRDDSEKWKAVVGKDHAEKKIGGEFD